jgi:hypothetical protein
LLLLTQAPTGRRAKFAGVLLSPADRPSRNDLKHSRPLTPPPTHAAHHGPIARVAAVVSSGRTCIPQSPTACSFPPSPDKVLPCAATLAGTRARKDAIP